MHVWFSYVAGHDIIQETATEDTDYEYSTWKSVTGSKSFVFQVKTGQNANIILSNKLQDITSVFEIVIGLDSDDKIVMRKSINGVNDQVMSQPNVISPDEYRTFWISWSKGDQISIGLGHTTGVSELLSMPEIDTTKIEAVAVTSGRLSKGTWRMTHFGGML